MGAAGVLVLSTDELARAGAISCLAGHPEIQVHDRPDEHRPEVVVVIEERITAAMLTDLSTRRAATHSGRPYGILVTADLPRRYVLRSIECGVFAVLSLRDRRVGEQLIQAVLAAGDGNGYLPPHHQGALLDQVRRLRDQVLEPNGVTISGLTERERDVIAMIADGYSTAEIAHRLTYSERTIKNTLQNLVARHGLRNRVHAVAHAIRSGAC